MMSLTRAKVLTSPGEGTANVAEGTRGMPGASGGLFETLKRYGFSDRRVVPSLDGLRAIAIGFLFIAHLSGTRGFLNWPFLYRYGMFGVRVFFVISGFLITSILLNEIRKTGRISLPRFYFRRTMRLFPACYVLIAVTALLAMNGIVHLKRGDLLLAVTYTMNYRFVREWPLGHLWSLAVEEQFYLLWPATLMLLGRTRSIRVLIGVLGIAPLIRLALPLLGQAAAFLIWSDALASGCLLALLRQDLLRSAWYVRVLSSRWFVLVPAVALAANAVPFLKVSWLLCETIMNLAIAMSIDWSIRNPGTAVGRFLNWPATCFIGVLSYSLYLWQQPFLNRASQSLYCAFPVNVALAVATAMVSYLVVEAPLLRLRMAIERRWQAKKQAEAAAASNATKAQELAWADHARDQGQGSTAARVSSRMPDQSLEHHARAGR